MARAVRPFAALCTRPRRTMFGPVVREWLTILALTVATGSPGVRHSPAALHFFEQVMSPFCPGVLLANCPSAPAAALRSEIERRIAAGQSADAIEADLERRFGERVLAAPRASGWGLIAWLTPGTVIGLGGLATARWLRRHAAGPTAIDSAVRPPDAAHLAVLERELAEL